jgi:hypothetical protein
MIQTQTESGISKIAMLLLAKLENFTSWYLIRSAQPISPGSWVATNVTRSRSWLRSTTGENAPSVRFSVPRAASRMEFHTHSIVRISGAGNGTSAMLFVNLGSGEKALVWMLFSVEVAA